MSKKEEEIIAKFKNEIKKGGIQSRQLAELDGGVRKISSKKDILTGRPVPRMLTRKEKDMFFETL